MEEVAEARPSLHLSKCHIVGNHTSRLIYRNKEILWISCHVFRVCTANIVGTDQTYSGPSLSCLLWNGIDWNMEITVQIFWVNLLIELSIHR